MTENRIGDAPMLPELLAQIPTTETMIAVSGDGAYDIKGCHAAIAARGAAAGNPPIFNGGITDQTRMSRTGKTGRPPCLLGHHRVLPNPCVR